MQTTFEFRTDGPGLTDITAGIAAWIPPGAEGLLTLFIRHTSCSLLIQENADPDVQRDLLAWLGRFIPPSDDPAMSYLRHTAEGPDDMPAHLKAAVLPVSLQIPVQSGRMRLGTWQSVYLFEHRTRPRSREVAAHLA
ncbi:secondary thiamine-phosphate synthase enzyme YjbQ [Histidinibacterium lentulum]|uniref:YjbQ family protein n=1 Tax=Histidinibacterium lentulum TaxID=2480588 RepID=A0A3N2R7F0_9RHOB|nr:secondary thiamine-phosphate synthase enzyme YjbQ [Histidinibacterium lentulum]ROU03313.1 YjbQ family protein [Histidinibacterium lentulum]